MFSSGRVDSVRSSHLHLVGPTGAVHLTDLLHGGGRGAGDASAEQLPTRPPDFQSRRLRVQRRQTPQRDVRPALRLGRVAAAASNPSAGTLHLRMLATREGEAQRWSHA